MNHQNDPRVDHLGPPPAQDPAKPNKPGTNTNPHWKQNSAFGNTIAHPQTVIIHETTGWPSSASVDNFVQRFLCLEYEIYWIPAKTGPPPIPAHWDAQIGRAIGPQFYVDGNGTAFSLIGQHNLPEQPRITVHAEGMSFFAIGIENGDVGDGGGNLRPANNANGPLWWRLTSNTEDLPGLMVFALTHPTNAPDLNLIWFATEGKGQAIPNYPGSGDTDQIATRYSNWNNMLFTERNYRSLALLCRFIAENWGLPRNFPLLPYMRVEADSSDRKIFRRLLLGDQSRDAQVAKFHFSVADAQNDTATYQSHYSQATWRSFFGTSAGDFPVFRGFQSHDINGHHPCPGPMFDWHRFAREVWDWWWYPFDTDMPAVQQVPARRPYLRARKDTPLIGYYYDSTSNDASYASVAVATEDQARGAAHYAVTAGTPIYAMANGVLVAARLPSQSDVNNPGFALVRHEVFWRSNQNRIDYDQPPSMVWSLTTYINAATANYTQTSDDNPDWLNRLLMRLIECEAAVAFHTSQPANAALQSGWDRVPAGEGPRLSYGQLVERDATAYRRLVTDLQAGSVVFPTEADGAPTPVLVILGDYLGVSGTMHNSSPGFQVQIFSKDPLAVANANQDALVWATQDWWTQATADARRHVRSPAADLPQDGFVWQYDMLEFLAWINNITWGSEWLKYGLPGNQPQVPLSRSGI